MSLDCYQTASSRHVHFFIFDSRCRYCPYPRFTQSGCYYCDMFTACVFTRLICYIMVRMTGVEPARILPSELKSDAFANFATSVYNQSFSHLAIIRWAWYALGNWLGYVYYPHKRLSPLGSLRKVPLANGSFMLRRSFPPTCCANKNSGTICWDSNPHLPILETGVLPIKLRLYVIAYFWEVFRHI